VIAIAVEESADDARPWVDEAGAEYTTALDPDHRWAESYGIVNVPSVVWLDEGNRVVRTPDIGYGDDTWIDFHGVDPEPALDALRSWVVDDRAPDGDLARTRRRPPSDGEQLARLHHRIALHLRRDGRDDGAQRHFAEAARLAPDDWTIRRGSIPLQGGDPFGAEFFAFYQEWEDRGRHLYDD
jgi:hypothetical protein